jgi:hypothetical protein
MKVLLFTLQSPLSPSFHPPIRLPIAKMLATVMLCVLMAHQLQRRVSILRYLRVCWNRCSTSSVIPCRFGPDASMGRREQDDGRYFINGDGEVNPAPGNGNPGGGDGLKRPIMRVAGELPDTLRSTRRPPILPEFQNRPVVHAIYHRFFIAGKDVKAAEIRVLSQFECFPATDSRSCR